MQLTWESLVALLALVSAICGVFLYITTLMIKREINDYHTKLTDKLEGMFYKIREDFITREIADMQFKHYGQLYESVSQRIAMLNDMLKQASGRRSTH